MPKTVEPVVAKVSKAGPRHYDTLEPYVKALTKKNYSDFRLSKSALAMLTQIAEQTVLDIAEGGFKLMHWKGTGVTVQSKDVETFISVHYPKSTGDAMVALSRIAERRYRAGKPDAAE
jgi:histone H3/H4